MELEILERVALSDTAFGSLINIDKRQVGGGPRTPLLDEPLKVETSAAIGKLPRTIADGLERDDIGVVDSRHVD